MGSCLSWLCSSRSKSSKYSAAYRKDLSAKLLEESASELSAKAIVLMIKVKSIERLPQVQRKSSILGLPTYINCNCFLEMKLLREDTAISGDQLQRGLIVPNTTDPTWEPAEKYQFLLSRKENVQILVSAFHYDDDDPTNPVPVGDAVLRLDDVTLHETPRLKILSLINPYNGRQEGEVRTFLMATSPGKAGSIKEEKVFEYEHYGLTSWSHLADPARFSLADGTRWDDDIEKLCLSLPQGWCVDLQWYVVGQPRDPDGWFYATSVDAPYWYPSSDDSSFFFYRRRSWCRITKRQASNAISNTIGQKSTVAIFKRS